MNSLVKQGIQTVFAVSLVSLSLPVLADTYQAGVSHNRASSQATFGQRHPKVKSAAIGAGVGVAAGGLTGLVSHKGVGRGALIGAGTGAGIGLVHSSTTLKSHPFMRKSAEGSLAGFGLGIAATKGHGSGKKVAATTGIGAALGIGAGFLDKH